MRISIFPAHDDSAASARIRAFSLQRSLSALGHDARLEDAGPADVLFIQKRATPETLALARRAARAGTLVIYDVDDLGLPLWYSVAPTVLFRLLRVAHLVTTDTAGHRDLLLSDYGARAVEVVPDTIDYSPAGPARPDLPEGDLLRVLWFGHATNLPLFERYALRLAALQGVEVVVSTSAAAIAPLSARFPSIAFVPWTKDGFVALLQSCALTVLPHDGGENDRSKSNNRMIASITWGVPAVVSRTPEYERTAREAGVEQALFDGPEELGEVVERLRSPAARRAYLEAAQGEVWRRYSPEAVARRFLAVAVAGRDLPRAPAHREGVRELPEFVSWLRRTSPGTVSRAVVREAMHWAARWAGRGPLVRKAG